MTHPARRVRFGVCGVGSLRVSARKMDRWWMVIVAFAVAAGMVLLVMLAMSASPADGAAKVRPATPLTHTDRNPPDLRATTHRLLQNTKFASGM